MIDDRGSYSKGKPTDLIKYDWYYGNITEQHAILMLEGSSTNRFLVRESNQNLILTKQINGWISHDVIHRSPEGYHLEGKRGVFKTVSEMITHYQQYPIKGNQVLGRPAKKQPQGTYIA